MYCQINNNKNQQEMISTIFALLFMGMNNIVAVLPKEVEVPQFVAVKKSKGKGKGKQPYYAKYF